MRSDIDCSLYPCKPTTYDKGFLDAPVSKNRDKNGVSMLKEGLFERTFYFSHKINFRKCENL